MRNFSDKSKMKNIMNLIICLVIFITAPFLQADASDTLFLEIIESFDLTNLGVNLDIAVTPDGEVFTVFASNNGLQHLQKSSRTFSPVKINGVGKGYFFNPSSIEADRKGRLWIANPDMHEILVCDTAGNLLDRFNRDHIQLDRPEFLFTLPEGQIGAWDSRLMTLSVFSLSENRVDIKRVEIPGRQTCMELQSGDLACFDSDRGSIVKIRKGGKIAEICLKKEKSNMYSKIRHMENGPGNCLYITDAGLRQFRYFSSDLDPIGRFLIYERRFSHPAGFTFQEDNLWLIDEGRKELMHFAVRKAVTGFEHVLLGEEYLALGYFNAAIKEISIAKSLGTHSPDADMVSGKAHYGLQQYNEALSAFTHAKNAGRKSARFFMGNALFRLRRYSEAESAFTSAMAAGDDKRLILFNLGQTCLALNRFKDAEMFFTRLLNEYPTHLRAKIGLARSIMNQGRVQKAISILAPLVEKKGVGRIARHDLGICYLKAGHYEKAIHLLKRSSAEGPFFKEAFRGLEKAYRMNGDEISATQCRKKASRLKPDQLFTHYLLEDG